MFSGYNTAMQVELFGVYRYPAAILGPSPIPMTRTLGCLQCDG